MQVPCKNFLARLDFTKLKIPHWQKEIYSPCDARAYGFTLISLNEDTAVL